MRRGVRSIVRLSGRSAFERHEVEEERENVDVWRFVSGGDRTVNSSCLVPVGTVTSFFLFCACCHFSLFYLLRFVG